jgi:hypothetical protein
MGVSRMNGTCMFPKPRKMVPFPPLFENDPTPPRNEHPRPQHVKAEECEMSPAAFAFCHPSAELPGADFPRWLPTPRILDQPGTERVFHSQALRLR